MFYPNLQVLKGDAAAMHGIGSGRVLNSTSEDNVFINFSDHGMSDCKQLLHNMRASLALIVHPVSCDAM